MGREVVESFEVYDNTDYDVIKIEDSFFKRYKNNYDIVEVYDDDDLDDLKSLFHRVKKREARSTHARARRRAVSLVTATPRASPARHAGPPAAASNPGNRKQSHTL